MHRYVGHVTSAIEKSDVDQVLGRKQWSPRWGPPFGVLFARRASPCSSLPTLPGVTQAVLASSPCEGCCFRFSAKFHGCVFVRIDMFQSEIISCEETGCSKGLSPREGSRGLKSRVLSLLLLFFCNIFFTLFVRHRVRAFTTAYLDVIDCNFTTEL